MKALAGRFYLFLPFYSYYTIETGVVKPFGEEPGSSIGWFGILSFYLHYITPLSNVNTPRKRVCPDKRKALPKWEGFFVCSVWVGRSVGGPWLRKIITPLVRKQKRL